LAHKNCHFPRNLRSVVPQSVDERRIGTGADCAVIRPLVGLPDSFRCCTRNMHTQVSGSPGQRFWRRIFATPALIAALLGLASKSLAATPLQITTASIPAATVGTAYSTPVMATGGLPPYSWSVQSGGFPDGISIGKTNGIISGMPTASGSWVYSYPFTVYLCVKDTGGHSAYVSLVIKELPPTSGGSGNGIKCAGDGDLSTFGDQWHGHRQIFCGRHGQSDGERGPFRAGLFQMGGNAAGGQCLRSFDDRNHAGGNRLFDSDLRHGHGAGGAVEDRHHRDSGCHGWH